MNASTTTELLTQASTTFRGTKKCDITEDIYQNISVIAGGFLTVFITTLGIPGNLMNCLIFFRQGLSSRMNLCLFFLSSVDFTLHALTFPIGCLRMLSITEHYQKYLQFLFGTMCALKSTSLCYNTVISVERCLCVIFPMTATIRIKTRTWYLDYDIKYKDTHRNKANAMVWLSMCGFPPEWKSATALRSPEILSGNQRVIFFHFCYWYISLQK